MYKNIEESINNFIDLLNIYCLNKVKSLITLQDIKHIDDEKVEKEQ